MGVLAMKSRIPAAALAPNGHKALGRFLRHFRLRYGFSLRRVAAESAGAFSTSYLNHLEIGRQYHPAPGVLCAIAKAYACLLGLPPKACSGLYLELLLAAGY